MAKCYMTIFAVLAAVFAVGTCTPYGTYGHEPVVQHHEPIKNEIHHTGYGVHHEPIHHEPIHHHEPVVHHVPIHHEQPHHGYGGHVEHHTPVHHETVHHVPNHHETAHHIPQHGYGHAHEQVHQPIHHEPIVHHEPVHHVPIHEPIHHEPIHHGYGQTQHGYGVQQEVKPSGGYGYGKTGY